MTWHIGVNPIKWSNDDFRDLGGETPLETCLKEAREAGYEGIELGHKMERDAAVLKPILDRHGLRLISGWHSTYLLDCDVKQEEASLRQHLRFLKAMGCDVAILAECGQRTYHEPSLRMVHHAGAKLLSNTQWDRLAAGLEHLASICEGEGMKPAYHHHMGTVVQDGEQLAALMDRTVKLGLTADSGHMAYGGMDPVETFGRYAKRIFHVHFKDVRRSVIARAVAENLTFSEAVRAGAFTVPGDGDLDFRALTAILKKADYQGWIVVEAEQDPKVANPLVYAKKGREHLRAIL